MQRDKKKFFIKSRRPFPAPAQDLKAGLNTPDSSDSASEKRAKTIKTITIKEIWSESPIRGAKSLLADEALCHEWDEVGNLGRCPTHQSHFGIEAHSSLNSVSDICRLSLDF
jgi:hypothetical protein